MIDKVGMICKVYLVDLHGVSRFYTSCFLVRLRLPCFECCVAKVNGSE